MNTYTVRKYEVRELIPATDCFVEIIWNTAPKKERFPVIGWGVIRTFDTVHETGTGKKLSPPTRPSADYVDALVLDTDDADVPCTISFREFREQYEPDAIVKLVVNSPGVARG